MYGNNLKLFSGNANKELASAIAKNLGVELANGLVQNFQMEKHWLR